MDTQQVLINQYLEGLDRDTNKHEYKNTKYFNLENGKIISQDGLATATISNVKGTISILDNGNNNITNIPGYTLVGWCMLQSDIILFYSNDTTDKGQIYKLSQVTEQEFSIELVYEDDNLNFGTNIQAIGRYENEYVQKIYWIDDFNNMLRSLNIAGTLPIIIDIDKLNIIQNTEFSIPTFVGFTGGQLQSGIVQYAYRYYNLNGIETIYSPCSALIPLTSEKETVKISLYKGTAAGINTQKGVIGQITGLDTSYDRIEIVSIWYGSLNGTPSINVISRQPFSDTIQFTDNGSYIASITLDEFTMLKNSLYAKTMVVKDDRLFLGNIQDDIFWNNELANWDSRAYRYAINSTDFILMDNNVSITYSDVVDVPVSSDAINNTNDVSQDANVAQQYNQYYKYNSSDLGGTGINISYEFTANNDYVIDNNTKTSCHIADVGTETLGIKRSFQRDEIYRFGIVFYDKYGRSSYVKWIGDIRMPFWNELSKYSELAGNTLAHNLYPIFTVSNLPTDVEQWQIVYVKRESYDRTVVGTGLSFGVEDNNGSYLNMANIIWIDNTNVTTAGTITGIRNGGLHWLAKYPIVTFESPEVLYGVRELTGSYLDLIGYFNASDNDITYRDPTESVEFRRTKLNSFIAHSRTDNSYRRREITDLQLFRPSQDSNVGGYAYSNIGDNDGTTSSIPPSVPYEEQCSSGTKWVLGLESKYDDTSVYFASPTHLYNVGVFAIRKNIIPYGGNTYNDRYNNTYIIASDIVDKNTLSTTCYYGDTYIGICEYLRCIYQEDKTHPMQEWVYFPIESSINLPFEYGYAQSKSLSISIEEPEPTTFTEFKYTDYIWLDESRLYRYNNTYLQQSIIKQFFPIPQDINITTKYPYQVKYSDLKYDGEEIDSWLSFRPLNMAKCIGNYGEITNLIEQTNQIYCFQEHGVSAISSNRQELTSGTSGVPITLGTGGVLDRFDYISTEVGCQFGDSVITSISNIYWLDKALQKMYRIGVTGMETLSDAKFVGSLFKTVVDRFSWFDGVYDIKDGRAYFTLHNTYPNYLATVTYSSTGIYTLSFDVNSIINRSTSNGTVLQLGNIYTFSYNGISGRFRLNAVDADNYTLTVEDLDNIINDTTPNYTIDLSELIDNKNQFTVTYSEFIDNYEAFHSFIPDVYLESKKCLFTYKDSEKEIFLHNVGDYGNYYNASDAVDLRLDLIVNGSGKQIREFNNINWRSECTLGNQDLKDETIKYIQVENNYQQSEKIRLYPMLDDDYVFFSESINLPNTTWSASGTYDVDSVVRYTDDKLYIGVDSPINASDVPGSSAIWDEYKLCNLRRVKRQWNTPIPRDEDNYLDLPIYNITNYRIGDAVQYMYKRYTCKVRVSTYDSNEYYNTDSYVLYGGTIYRSDEVQKGSTPGGSTWTNVTSAFTPSGTDDNTIYWDYAPIYNRMLDSYIRINLYYPNVNNRKLVLHDVQTTCEIQV